MSDVKQIPVPQPANKIKGTSHLSAGFVSGLSSSILLQPLDLLKTRVQQEKMSLRSAITQINSVKDLWRGTIPSAVRTSVGSALYFTTLNATRTYFASNTARAPNDGRPSSSLPRLSMSLNLLSGAAVRGFVGFLTMPVTVVKVRYESSVHNYTSIGNAIGDIYRRHGVPGFFSGYIVTFFRDAPYAGLYVLFYEKSKDILNIVARAKHARNSGGRESMDTTSSMAVNSASAVVSATLATALTGPFDTIKTRVQIDPEKYPNMVQSARLIVQEGGFRALFHGLSLRLSRKAMSAGIAWCVYEELIKKL